MAGQRRNTQVGGGGPGHQRDKAQELWIAAGGQVKKHGYRENGVEEENKRDKNQPKAITKGKEKGNVGNKGKNIRRLRARTNKNHGGQSKGRNCQKTKQSKMSNTAGKKQYARIQTNCQKGGGGGDI